MKSMVFTVLQTYVYNNVLVMKYFCTSANFWGTYYSDLSNPGPYWAQEG